jgi:hypothetical protein
MHEDPGTMIGFTFGLNDKAHLHGVVRFYIDIFTKNLENSPQISRQYLDLLEMGESGGLTARFYHRQLF